MRQDFGRLRRSDPRAKKNGRCETVSLTRPFRIPSPVARDQVMAERSYQLPKFCSCNTDRRLVSFGRLQPPSVTNKPIKPVRHSSAGVQGHANHSDQLLLSTNRTATSSNFYKYFFAQCISAQIRKIRDQDFFNAVGFTNVRLRNLLLKIKQIQSLQ